MTSEKNEETLRAITELEKLKRIKEKELEIIHPKISLEKLHEKQENPVIIYKPKSEEEIKIKQEIAGIEKQISNLYSGLNN